MTPEAKAKELLDKFWKMGDIYPQTTFAYAKLCAIICVQEIIDVTINKEVLHKWGIEYPSEKMTEEYWQSVLSELKKM